MLVPPGAGAGCAMVPADLAQQYVRTFELPLFARASK